MLEHHYFLKISLSLGKRNVSAVTEQVTSDLSCSFSRLQFPRLYSGSAITTLVWYQEIARKGHTPGQVGRLLGNLCVVQSSVLVIMVTIHLSPRQASPRPALWGIFCLGFRNETVPLNIRFIAQDTQYVHAIILVSLKDLPGF